jgi:L-asparaginase II
MRVEVTRGQRVESVHAVAACACDAAGHVRFAAGKVDEPVFTRSALKPFIAAAVVRAGAADQLGLDDRDLAIMSASHSAEAVHRDAATAVLAKAGATVDDLRCGAPDGTPSPLFNNCSGKHAGILVLTRALDAPFGTYFELEHPAQQTILAFCERIFGEPLRGDRLGVDGCGIPNVAVSLQRIAAAFARLAESDSGRSGGAEDDAALRRVRDAMRAHPHLVAGTGRLDTDLGRVTGGRIVAKAGAEGVHGFALVERGLGIALKIADGARRADGPASIAVLTAAGALDEAHRSALAAHVRTPVRNVAGRVVGEVRATAEA